MYSQRIRSVMTQEKLLTATPQATVAQAARLMAAQGVGAAVVVDEQGQLVGMFTERDALFRVIARGRDPGQTRVAEVMTSPVVTAHPEKEFGFALQLMHENRFRHVPVVEGGKVVGIVSARDALDPDMEEFVCEVQRRVAIR
jgi:CBS domain-containing protein